MILARSRPLLEVVLDLEGLCDVFDLQPPAPGVEEGPAPEPEEGRRQHDVEDVQELVGLVEVGDAGVCAVEVWVGVASDGRVLDAISSVKEGPSVPHPAVADGIQLWDSELDCDDSVVLVLLHLGPDVAQEPRATGDEEPDRIATEHSVQVLILGQRAAVAFVYVVIESVLNCNRRTRSLKLSVNLNNCAAVLLALPLFHATEPLQAHSQIQLLLRTLLPYRQRVVRILVIVGWRQVDALVEERGHQLIINLTVVGKRLILCLRATNEISHDQR